MDFSVGFDGQNCRFVGLVGTGGSDIARGTIAVGCSHFQVEFFAGGQGFWIRRDRDLGQDWVGFVDSGEACLDPLDKGLVVGRIGFKFFTATVGELRGCFLEQEAIGRGGGLDASSAGIGDDGAEVHVGVETQQGECKSVLTAGLAVAGAGVATTSGENGLDIEFEFSGTVGGIGFDKSVLGV